jgi:hypothetical protein
MSAACPREFFLLANALDNARADAKLALYFQDPVAARLQFKNQEFAAP